MRNVELFGIMRNSFVFLVLILGFLILGFVSGAETVSVVILNNEMGQAGKFSVATEDVEVNITHELSSIDGFAAEVNVDDMDALREKFDDMVFVDKRKFSATLDVSVPMIGGENSWNLENGYVNLTGAGQTICVIDTGVNYSHPALGGCYGNNDPNSSCKVLGGYNYIEDNNDPLDDNGHGTHVSGIIISNDSTYKGVAPASKIIAMKVLDSSGSSESGADILAAIDWCVSNASKFNISVISMSLGDNSTYNSYCDGESIIWDNMINGAVAAGIAVVISAGNCDSVGQSCTTGVAFPACIESATRVGAVNDSDVISYMRGALFELMAPGISVASSVIGGGFGNKSGTSMSAPHVSGAIVLMRQYLNLSGQLKSVDEIESVLNNSGVCLDDSLGSGYNFTRINIYDALLFLDVDDPNVTLVFPVDGHVNLSVNQSFVCNVSDWQLANLTFEIWNSSGVYYNESVNLTGTSNETSFDLANMPEGAYNWNCLGVDLKSNEDYASSNFSLTIGGIEVNLISPANASYTNVNETAFNCTASSDASYRLSNMTFRIWNSSGVLVWNETQNVSGFENGSIFNYSFDSDDSYLWDCVALNNHSDEGDGVNYSLVYDSVAPVINITSSPTSETLNSVLKSFGFNVSDENIANCSLVVDGVSVLTNSSVNVSVGQLFSRIFTPGTYVWNINCSDLAGNVNASVNSSFVISAVVVTSSGSSGGGGGGSSSTTKEVLEEGVYVVEASEVSHGYTKSLEEGEKLNFSLYDFDGGRHLLEVNDVQEDYVLLTVRSDPIYLKLGEGQSAKLNLSSANYYDLFLKVENIIEGKAELTIQLINEPIVVKTREEIVIEKEVVIEGQDYFWLVMVLIGILSGIVGVVLKKKKLKGQKSRKKKNGKQD